MAAGPDRGPDPGAGAGPPLRPPAHRVDPAARWLWALQGAVLAAVLAAAVVGLSLAVPADAPRWLDLLVAAARWLLVPVALVLVVVQPLWRFRVHRWEVTADAVYTLTGWLTRTWTLVPISRIQTVDVTRGVLQQLFGLSTVAVLTASSQGTVRVWHLEADVAQRVADDLAHRAEQVRDIAT